MKYPTRRTERALAETAPPYAVMLDHLGVGYAKEPFETVGGVLLSQGASTVELLSWTKLERQTYALQGNLALASRASETRGIVLLYR
jgi:hypothetical protein